jgi:hypothetical protein
VQQFCAATNFIEHIGWSDDYYFKEAVPNVTDFKFEEECTNAFSNISSNAKSDAGTNAQSDITTYTNSNSGTNAPSNITTSV